MRDISGADFKFAKTLTLDFFGSGMVDLPPGGAKRVKNSRKMQMVFFVFYGRVEVSMGTPLKTFSIGKGGQWQVPRGKLFRSLSLAITTPRFLLKEKLAQRQEELLSPQLPLPDIKKRPQLLVKKRQFALATAASITSMDRC